MNRRYLHTLLTGIVFGTRFWWPVAWQASFPTVARLGDARSIRLPSRVADLRIADFFRKRPVVSLHASDPLRNNENLNGADQYVDLDELWMDEALEEFDYLDGDEPEAYLSEDDLSFLYDIEIPSLASETTQDASLNGTNPQVISLKDLNHLASDLSYFYLRDEVGLGEDVMWAIANSGASTVLMMKVANVRHKVELLRKMMKLSDEELRKLLSAKPGLLQLSANKNLSPTILFLVRQLDLGTTDLKTLVLGCPALLAYSIPNLQEKLEFFERVLGCTVDETRKILLGEPRILTSAVNEGILPRYRFLFREVQIPRDDIKTIIKKNPRILVMSVDQNLQPKIIFFLIMTLMMTPEDVRKLLLKYPGFLNFNLENHVLPIIRYFLSLDISANEIASILLKFPRLVTNSLVKIKRTVGYLRYELGLDADGVRRILYQAPEIVGLSAANLESKVDYLFGVVAPRAARDDKDSIQTLGQLITGMPSLLHLNMERNLKPKATYLCSRLGEDGLSEALQRMPMLLAYSLEKRIQPRMEMILAAGLDGGAITVGIPKGEQAFVKWLEARERKGQGKPRKSRKKSSHDDDDDDGDFVIEDLSPPTPQIKNTTEDGRGIVHWTRPRRNRNNANRQ